MTKEDAVITLNKLRLANKNKWVNTTITVEGLPLGIKAYNLWVQRIQYKSTRDGFTCTSVKDYKDSILELYGKRLCLGN